MYQLRTLLCKSYQQTLIAFVYNIDARNFKDYLSTSENSSKSIKLTSWKHQLKLV